MFVDLKDLKNKYQEYYPSYKKIPKDLHAKVFVNKASEDREFDVITPMKEGKRRFFHRMQKHQPKTYRVLTEESGEFVIGHYTDISLYHLYLPVCERLIKIDCYFYGRTGEGKSYSALPEPIYQAWFYDFGGMDIPTGLPPSIHARMLPTGYQNTIDGFLGDYRMKKKHGDFFLELFPEIRKKCTTKEDPWTGLRILLNTRPFGERIKEGDILLYRPYSDKKEVYHIRDTDCRGIRKLENPAEVLDAYCEHVLQRKEQTEGRFDFLPFGTPLV